MEHLVNQVLPQDIRKMGILKRTSILKVDFKSLGYFLLKGSKLVNSRQCTVLYSNVYLHLLILYFTISLLIGMFTPLQHYFEDYDYCCAHYILHVSYVHFVCDWTCI